MQSNGNAMFHRINKAWRFFLKHHRLPRAPILNIPSQRVYVNRILQCICQSQVKSFGLRLILPLPTLSSTFYVHMFRVWSFRSLNLPLCFLGPIRCGPFLFRFNCLNFQANVVIVFFLSSTALLFFIVIFIQFFMSFVWNFIFRITVCQSSCSPST